MDSIPIKLTLSFDYTVSAYALVIGGYFPLTLAFNDVILIDRNILRVLSCVSGQGTRQDAEANGWWLSHLDRSDRNINPVLCAMEGSEQSIPTYDQFCTAFDDACTYIQEHLPNANLVRFHDEAYQSAYAIIEETAERYIAETNFLLECAPLLAQPTARTSLRAKESTLFSLCEDYGLEVISLPFIAALSCLYEPRVDGEKSIGRGVIKPSMNYGANKAHNAISDLRALEMLALGNGLGIGSMAFCTRDKALTAFWCALNLKPGHWENEQAKVNFTLDESLFPALSCEEVNALYQRMMQ